MSHEPTPAALPVAIAPALLSAERLAELQRIVDEERTNHAGEPVTQMGFWPAAVEALLAHAAQMVEELDDQKAMGSQGIDHEFELMHKLKKATARVKEQQSELAEQERAKLRLIQESGRLKDAIRKASSQHLNAAEREAYASNTNGAGTRGAFGAGEIMGRVSLAQDLLNLFDL